MTYVGLDRLPQTPVTLHRYWLNGRIISARVLPPGSYHVKLDRIQSDWKGRLQYHWVLTDPRELEPRLRRALGVR